MKRRNPESEESKQTRRVEYAKAWGTDDNLSDEELIAMVGSIERVRQIEGEMLADVIGMPSMAGHFNVSRWRLREIVEEDRSKRRDAKHKAVSEWLSELELQAKKRNPDANCGNCPYAEDDGLADAKEVKCMRFPAVFIANAITGEHYIDPNRISNRERTWEEEWAQPWVNYQGVCGEHPEFFREDEPAFPKSVEGIPDLLKRRDGEHVK